MFQASRTGDVDSLAALLDEASIDVSMADSMQVSETNVLGA